MIPNMIIRKKYFLFVEIYFYSDVQKLGGKLQFSSLPRMGAEAALRLASGLWLSRGLFASYG